MTGKSRLVLASSGNLFGSSFFSPLGPKCSRTMSSSVGRPSSRWLLSRFCRMVLSGISLILRSAMSSISPTARLTGLRVGESRAYGSAAGVDDRQLRVSWSSYESDRRLSFIICRRCVHRPRSGSIWSAERSAPRPGVKPVGSIPIDQSTK